MNRVMQAWRRNKVTPWLMTMAALLMVLSAIGNPANADGAFYACVAAFYCWMAEG